MNPVKFGTLSSAAEDVTTIIADTIGSLHENKSTVEHIVGLSATRLHLMVENPDGHDGYRIVVVNVVDITDNLAAEA